MGWCFMLTTVSEAWKKASMPCQAVNFGGTLIIRLLSTTERVGIMEGKKIPVFSFVASLLMTDARSTSLAVPAEVVMQTIGSALLAGVFLPPFPLRE